MSTLKTSLIPGGMHLVRRIHKLEKDLDNLGMCLGYTEYADSDDVAISPKDPEHLPLYSRDAKLFIGTLDGAETWVQGIMWARMYDSMLFGNKHEEKRKRKEQDVRNKKLANILVYGNSVGEKS